MTDERSPDEWSADEEPVTEPMARRPGRPEPPRPTPRPAPETGEGGGRVRGIHVDMAPRHVLLTPGEAQTATITVRNLGSIVDEVTLNVIGGAAPWTRVAPASLNIYPGTEAQAAVRFAPPRAPTPLAGLLQLDIDVSSSAQPESSTLFSTSLEISPYDNLAVTADGPTMLSGVSEAVLPLRVRNLGNRPTNIRLHAVAAGGTSVGLSVSSLAMEAGAEANVFATVRPPAQVPGHPARMHPFTVTVESDHAAPVTVDARMEQPAAPLPPKASSRRPLLAALGLLGLAAAALAVVAALAGWIPGVNLGGTANTDGPTPTAGAIVTTPPDTAGPPTTEPAGELTVPPAPETTPPTPVPLPELSFAERAAGAWQMLAIYSPYFDDLGYAYNNVSGRLDVTGTDFTWWWPATESPEVLTCHGQLETDVLRTPDDPETDLQRASEIPGYALDSFAVEVFVAELCGVTADVLPDGPITVDSFTNTYLSHGDWRVALGGDDLTQPAPTLDMFIDIELDGYPIVTTINWVR